MAHTEALRGAFESRDLNQLVGLMDEGIVWRGVPRREEEGGTPVCTNRDQVRSDMQHFLDGGGDAEPVVLAESGDSVLIEVRPSATGHEHPPGTEEHDHEFPDLWQVMAFRAGRIVLIQDYLDKAEAFRALG